MKLGTYTNIANWYTDGFDLNLIAKVESGGVFITGTITTKIYFSGTDDINIFGLDAYPYGRDVFNDHNIILATSHSQAMIYPYSGDTRYFRIRFFKAVSAGMEFYVCGKAFFL